MFDPILDLDRSDCSPVAPGPRPAWLASPPPGLIKTGCYKLIWTAEVVERHACMDPRADSNPTHTMLAARRCFDPSWRQRAVGRLRCPLPSRLHLGGDWEPVGASTDKKLAHCPSHRKTLEAIPIQFIRSPLLSSLPSSPPCQMSPLFSANGRRGASWLSDEGWGSGRCSKGLGVWRLGF